MSRNDAVCPICATAAAECGHEVLRLSGRWEEYAESPLAKAAERFEQAVLRRLELAWALNVPPKDTYLKKIYRDGQLFLGPHGELKDAYFQVGSDIREWVLDSISQMGDVLQGEEAPDIVLYSEEPGWMLDRVENQIREMELETEREAASWGKSRA